MGLIAARPLERLGNQTPFDLVHQFFMCALADIGREILVDDLAQRLSNRTRVGHLLGGGLILQRKVGRLNRVASCKNQCSLDAMGQLPDVSRPGKGLEPFLSLPGNGRLLDFQLTAIK